MEEVRQRFIKAIDEFHMLRTGGRVVAAVSGGADSVCLLALLCGLRQERKIQVRALHVHHGLRGPEADRDAEFVRELCGRLNVPVQVRYVDVRAYAAENRLSEEEAGRTLRYRELEKCATEWEMEVGLGMDGPEAPLLPIRIAVAHHGDDQAETILHNLCRGSGLRGLGGMQPVRGRIIRPLLAVSRSEILEWLSAQGLSYCEDSTNRSDCYTRNRIRQQLIPMLREQVNPGAVDSILRMGRLASQADNYLASQAGAWVSEHVKTEGGRYVIPDGEFLSLPEILKTYSIFQIMENVGGCARDLTAGHVDQVLRLFHMAVGHSQDLPYGIRAVREYGSVVLFRERDRRPGRGQARNQGQGQGQARNQDQDRSQARGQNRNQDQNHAHAQGQPENPQVRVDFACFSYKKGTEIPKNQYTKWFDCGKIKGMPVVRSRQTGDYITLADGRKKTVRRFMIDEKIPREQRDSVPLLADGSHVMWIIGYRISEYYKIGPDTVRVLEAHAQIPEA